ncbi:acyltransferase family protein [Bradyrhizobium sp. HKCCYLS20291]|uniref:acyltransferase family protein n=1 Tax=Bradyrhizobium sp. HKCCYLS20291 TaxID=3420766 RepID=UPI003EB823F7
MGRDVSKADLGEATRRPFLDGLRGSAACIVFFGHLVLAVFPGLVSFKPDEMHFAAETWLGVSLVSWIWKGSFAVCIFFVLSGYVLAGFSEATTLSLTAQTVRRYLRLAMPMLMTSTIAWAIMAAGLMSNVAAARIVTHSEWLAMWYQGFEPSFWSMVREALYDAFRNGRADYNSNLWTMRIELIGSVTIFLAYVCFRNVTVRIAATVLYLALNYDSYYALFAVGVLFHEFEAWVGATLVRLVPSSHVREILTGMVFLVGLYFGAYSHTPEGIVPAWHSFFPRSLPTTASHMIGAVLVVGALLYNKRLQSWLGGAFGQYLGRLSFVLYLVHIPIICSVAAACALALGHQPYAVNAAVTMLVTTAVVFGVSTLLCRTVDVTTTGLSRDAGKLVDRWFPACDRKPDASNRPVEQCSAPGGR